MAGRSHLLFSGLASTLDQVAVLNTGSAPAS
jgi:hypothetical protein